jgi:phosphoribosylanthranilate isomerase
MMVKVCGITRREDAEVAVEAGASAIGFIFYPKSPRYIAPEKARELGAGLDVLKVGVFVDETPASIESVMRSANLDVAQIYGGAALSGSRVWKAQRVNAEAPEIDKTDCEAILLDGQSNGLTFNWKLALGAAEKVIIAGGLDASNVAEAIRVAEPWGVDASSKLESSPGIKDHEKMKQFIKAALEASR